jgi:CDP-diglyceride synthetase
MTAWKDLPRRLLTVGLGVPSIVLILRHPITSWLFFQGAHLICLIEWRALLPPPLKFLSSNDNNDETELSPSNIHILANDMYYTLFIFSILITIIPTSYLPVFIIFFTIILRLIPHCAKYQSLPPSTIISTAHNNNNNNDYNKENDNSSDENSNNACIIMSLIQHYQFGLTYISIGFHYLICICQVPVGGPIHIGNLLFIVWMSDTGALIVGRTISSYTSTTRIESSCCRSSSSSRENSSSKPATTSFLSSISPGKTIAGLLGAVITGPISAVIYSSILLPSSSSLILKDVYNKQQQQQCDDNGVISSSFTSLRCFIILSNHPMIQQLILGLLLSMAGIVGDLAESSVKRLSMKKDSGKLLPGHGGVVDRFDSLFVSAVVYYYWMLV